MLGCSVMGCLMMGRFVWEPYEDIWLLGKIGFFYRKGGLKEVVKREDNDEAFQLTSCLFFTSITS